MDDASDEENHWAPSEEHQLTSRLERIGFAGPTPNALEIEGVLGFTGLLAGVAGCAWWFVAGDSNPWAIVGLLSCLLLIVGLSAGLRTGLYLSRDRVSVRGLLRADVGSWDEVRFSMRHFDQWDAVVVEFERDGATQGVRVLSLQRPTTPQHHRRFDEYYRALDDLVPRLNALTGVMQKRDGEGS